MCKHSNSINNFSTMRVEDKIVTYCTVCGESVGEFEVSERRKLENLTSFKPDGKIKDWAKSKRVNLVRGMGEGTKQ